jgi:VWFA-related protein
MPAFAQDVSVRIGIAVPRSESKEMPLPEARDRLVKTFNQQKPEKKLRLAVNAVPLDDAWGSKAMAAAREQQCQFVLSTHLMDARTSSVLTNNGAEGMDYLPVYSAVVEYRLIRVVDGAGFAIGSVREEDPTSLRDAVWQALSRVARQAVADIGKGGNVPHIDSLVPPSEAEIATTQPGDITIASNPCSWLPSNVPHDSALRGVCQYALSLPTTMPNFICDQDASRYRGKANVPFDLITAAIRYEDGNETFKEIKVNGKPVVTPPPGIWSTGEFGSNLRSIFDPWNQPLFKFVGEKKLGDRAAWVVSYEIAKQNDPLWRLHGGDQVLAPPYKGEIWIDEKTGELLRFGSVARDLPDTFQMAGADLQINYASVRFGDGSSFILPADFTVTTSYRAQEPTRNVVQFRNCQKFRAHARMLLKVPGAANERSASVESTPSAELKRELDESETIYTILREQAVREDAAAIELERQQEVNAATAATWRRMRELEKERQKNLVTLAASAKDPSGNEASAKQPPPTAKESLTTLKVSVRLVQVSAVLRDAKGHAVGNLRKEDFQLFDNGKPQMISSFSTETAGRAKGERQVAASSDSTPASPNIPPPAAGRDVAYIFDDIYTTFEDLASARDAAVQHLTGLRPEDRAAIFTTSGQLGLNFTADRQKLQDALNGLRPHPLTSGPQCPPMTHYMADLIVNQDDRETLGMATKDAVNCAFGGMAQSGPELARAEQIARSTAIQVLSTSSSEIQSSLGILREVIARTSVMEGTRSIVLVSPGLLTLTADTRQSVAELTDRALRANIVINTLDVRGLYTPVAAPNSSHPAAPVQRFRLDREEALARSDVLADLAYSTGGTFFHNNNDLNEGFRRTADAPEYIYVLGFSPQKSDGKFHKLKVTLKGPGKLTVQARQGYYALKPAPVQ